MGWGWGGGVRRLGLRGCFYVGGKRLKTQKVYMCACVCVSEAAVNAFALLP